MEDKQRKDWLDDERYQKANSITKPVLAYILEEYKNEPADALSGMDDFLRRYMGIFLVLGIELLPLAIELSQWDYDVHFVVEDRKYLPDIEEAVSKHAGVIKRVVVADYFKDVPQARVCVAYADSDDVGWYEMLAGRCNEALLIADDSRDWSQFLSPLKRKLIKETDERSYIAIRK
jgi:hypothetical protein